MPIASNPSTTLYTLGKGVVTIAEYDDNDTLGTYADVGNAPSFSLTLSEEKLEHFSSRSGAKRKDEEVTIQVGYSINFVLDEFSVGNLARYLRGSMTGTRVIRANTNLTKKYSVKFTSDNAHGPNNTWTFHRCTLKPNGELNLISDEWNSMPFMGEGLDDSVANPTDPYFNVEFETTTTTTTTSSTTSSSTTTTTTTA